MKRLLYACATLLFALTAVTAITAVTAYAATDVTGVWTGELKGPDGNGFPISFTFKQDGAALTGSVAGPQGDPIAISDGKVDGSTITFKVSFNGMTISHTGTVSGEEIKLTTKSNNGDFPGGEMTLKRTPPPAAKP
jgi:hypothetical protein